MELKTNNSHKKIDLNGIDLKNAKKVTMKVGTIAFAVYMGLANIDVEAKMSDTTDNTRISSSSYADSAHYIIPNHSSEEGINIPYMSLVQFDDDRVVPGSDYTYDDLNHIVSATIFVKDDGNYDFLNYMPNLKNLHLMNLSGTNKFSNIDGSRLSPGITIRITSPFGFNTFNRENYKFIEDAKEIDTLLIGSTDTNPLQIDSEYLQSLKNVHNLQLALDINSNFKYTDLKHLDSLYIDAKPYDAALYFSNEMLDELTKAGVNVSTSDMSKLRSINDKIHNIYKSLNINNSADDTEKLTTILVYVLENLNYDKEVSNAITNNENIEEIAKSFYTEGEMTAALEGKTQICGNYAALTYVLCRESGLDAYNLTSSNHSWNAVKVGDYYYFVDSTWLDGETITIANQTKEETEYGVSITINYETISAEEVLKSNDEEQISKLSWYMEDPTNLPTSQNHKESHDYITLPAGLVLRSIPENASGKEIIVETTAYETKESSPEPETKEEKVEEKDISKQKFKIQINNKTYIIAGAALAGILAGLGVGVLVHKKKVEERKRAERRRRMYMDYGWDNKDYNRPRHR